MKKKSMKKPTLKNIQQTFVRYQLVLIITLALFLGISGTVINIQFETQKRDRNLQNIAEAIAQSPLLIQNVDNQQIALAEYLDSLKSSLEDIDVISVVNTQHIRIYHSKSELVGTEYDGTIPDFSGNSDGYYASNDSGPSGTQRRAYAAVYDEDGNYKGFVIAVMLMENIRTETLQTLFIFTIITIAAILIELLISAELTNRIKNSLLGYEPDVFSAMYKIRDNILESLDEGVVAIDINGNVQFANNSAVEMLNNSQEGLGDSIIGKNLDLAADTSADIIIDCIPIKEDNAVVGTVGIFHDRAEYTKLMEDLAGTRYLVDSMRANNHDFTNKLHVILGLIQMEMYDEATSYIENITLVQRETISKIMKAVNEPAVAALLIGKTARASELNINFVLREGCHYSTLDIPLPAEALVTIIGNLIDNAFEAMNSIDDSYSCRKELLFGIYSRSGALLITIDDTGTGIKNCYIDSIFENGFSTKGEGRGTGLYQVKTLVENLGGTISVESQEGIGSSFSVSFTKQ